MKSFFSLRFYAKSIKIIQQLERMSFSLYIPRVSVDTTQSFISFIFERDYGKVNRVDLVNKISDNSENYYAAYIHFDYLYDNEMVRSLKKVIDHDDPSRIKNSGLVFYNDTSYWKVLKNRSKKVVSGDRREKIVVQLSSAKKEDEFPAPPLDQMLTNADFARMCWAPKKKEVEYILEDTEFKELCNTLFSEPEPCEIQNFDFVSADYARCLENEIAFLRNQLAELSNEVEKLTKYSDDMEMCQDLLLQEFAKSRNQAPVPTSVNL